MLHKSNNINILYKREVRTKVKISNKKKSNFLFIYLHAMNTGYNNFFFRHKFPQHTNGEHTHFSTLQNTPLEN